MTPPSTPSKRSLQAIVRELTTGSTKDPAQLPLGVISTSDIVAEMAAPDSVWQAASV